MRKAKAFTLVELLVVISIIALLLAVLMPTLNRARAAAKRTVCAARIKQVLTASIMVAQNNQRQALPRAGIHSRTTNLDDHLSMQIEDYFNVGSMFAKIPGNYSTSDPPLTQQTIEDIDTKLNQAGFQKIFVCTEIQGKNPRPSPLYADGRSVTFPFVAPVSTYWGARLGYSYLGGYATNTTIL